MFISSETESLWRTILGHLQLIECMGICILSLAHGSKLRGSDVICILQKKLSGKFSLNGARVCALGWPCWDFSLDFNFFLFKGGLRGKAFKGNYTVFGG